MLDPGIWSTQAIPVILLSWALLWTTNKVSKTGAPEPRIRPGTLKMSSWSWLKWKSSVRFSHRIDDTYWRTYGIFALACFVNGHFFC